MPPRAPATSWPPRSPSRWPRSASPTSGAARARTRMTAPAWSTPPTPPAASTSPAPPTSGSKTAPSSRCPRSTPATCCSARAATAPPMAAAADPAAATHLARTPYQWKKDGPVVPLSQIQPGDLLFSAGSDGTASDPGHVVMYLGNGQVIQAPQTGQDVQVDPVDLASIVVATRPAALATRPCPNHPESSSGDTLRTSGPPAPPLPKPQHPAVAAKALAEAAYAAAHPREIGK